MLCFEQVQCWKQWDGGSRGSQLWLSWEMSMQRSHAVQGSMSIVQCPQQMHSPCAWGGDWDGRCPWTQQGFLWRNTGLFSLTGVWQDDHSHLCVCHSTSMCIILAVWGQNMAPKIQKRFFTYTEHLTSVSVPWIKKKKQTKEMVLKVETGLHLKTLFLVYFSWGKTHYRPI